MSIQRTAQKAYILDKTRSKILLSKYVSAKYFPKDLVGKYGLPGGQMEFGEDPDRALVREVHEETGVTITPLLPFYIWEWQYEKEGQSKQIVAVARLCIYKSGSIKEPKTEKEVSLAKAEWLELKNIDLKTIVESERPIFTRYLSNLRNNPFLL